MVVVLRVVICLERSVIVEVQRVLLVSVYLGVQAIVVVVRSVMDFLKS